MKGRDPIPNEDVYTLALSKPAIRYNLRSVPYDTIRVCHADGDYHAKEQALIRQFTARFDIAENAVTQLEEVYTKTRRIRQKPLDLTFVQGAPYGVARHFMISYNLFR